MKETIAIFSALLAVIGNVPYLRDVIAQRVKPHPYTWFVWSIVSGITLFGQIAKGAGVGAWPTAVSEIFTIIIFLFATRYGFKGIVKKDTFFLVFALLGLIPWFITKDPTLSVIIVVAIDILAFIPTLRRAWVLPKTEIKILYVMNVLRHSLALFALQAYNVATMLHSLAMIVANSLMTVILIVRRKRYR